MKSKKLLTSLLALLPALALWSQTALQGTVSNSAGEALIGVSVSLKGTSIGAVTDTNGAFSLDVPPDGDQVLVVSYTGYGSREVTVRAGIRAIEITLEEGIHLRETVVTALGITRSEKSLGYAVSQVDGEDISKVRDPNIVNQLGGRAAGVTVIGSTGNFGSSARITIRGIKSINGNNQPLFVVDGVPMDNSNFTNSFQAGGLSVFNSAQYFSGFDYGSAILDLNPGDVESVSVLKGQAAAALYGSRGANGVILVSTKKGSKSDRRGIGVSIGSSLTWDEVAFFPDYQNSYGGGVDLRPHGFADNSGFYKIPLNEVDGNGNVVAAYQSFDLVPIYAVDESWGTRFATSTTEHFQHLEGIGYAFPNGYGAGEDFLMFRDWNSWDNWDTEHFGKSRRWEVGDHPREYFQTGLSSNQSIAFEGKGFRLSYNRFDQTGIYPNSKSARNTLAFNGSLDLGSHLTSFLGVNYVNTRTTGRSTTVWDARGGHNPSMNFNQWWHRELRFADLKTYLNPDGSQRTWNRRSAFDGLPQYWDNPYWVRHKNFQNDGRDRVFGNAGLTLKINSWLSATGRVLTDFYTERREERFAVGSYWQSQYILDEYGVNETNADLIVRAERTLANDFSVSAFAGGNKLWRSTRRHFGATRGGLNVPNIYRVQNSKERPELRNTQSEKEIESLFGGLTLGYRSLLYLDLTGRNDWSSALPDEHNSYFYPSASASFVFSELLHPGFLSFGKLRLGWARVGNDTDPYNVFDSYVANENFGNDPNYTVSNTLNNRGLKSEKTTSIEAGVDLRFFKNRLGIDVTVYSGKTVDQILPIATTPTTGYYQQFINAGEITNKGIEIGLNATPIISKDFRWDVRFNFGKNENKVVELNADDPTLTNIQVGCCQFEVTLNAYEGLPYGTLLGYDFLRDKNGNRLVDPNSGQYLRSTDLVPLGSVNPDFTGGITNTFSWKGFTFSVFVDFRKGGKIYSATHNTGNYAGILAETAEGGIRENGIVLDGVPALLDNSGQLILENEGDPNVKGDEVYASTGEANTIAADAQTHFYGGTFLGGSHVFDGSFIKLREMSLGYSLPQAWLGKTGIREATLSLIGRNLVILHKNIPHIDPDTAISTGNVQGLEGGMPQGTRSIGVSLNFKF